MRLVILGGDFGQEQFMVYELRIVDDGGIYLICVSDRSGTPKRGRYRGGARSIADSTAR